MKPRFEREGKSRGCIVAFSFTKGAREEVARVKAKQGVEIELVTVRDILIARGELRLPDIEDIFPAPLTRPTSFLDLPLPAPRRKAQRPSAATLIASARARRSI